MKSVYHDFKKVWNFLFLKISVNVRNDELDWKIVYFQNAIA